MRIESLDFIKSNDPALLPLLIKLISHIPTPSQSQLFALVEFCFLEQWFPSSEAQLIEIADKFERFVFTEVFCAFDNRSLHTSLLDSE